jgi:hypothetical protein
LRPAAAVPMHDPEGVLFPHLKEVTPLLKTIFERVYISIPQDTRARQAGDAAWVDRDEFFRVVAVPAATPVGAHFHTLYQAAAQSAPPEQIIHLCYIDRVAFALGGAFKTPFILDIQSLGAGDVPLVFHRSPSAWETHPRNYYEIEQMATLAGEMVFGKTLDFGWCHLAAQAKDLLTALQQSHNHDLSMVAELVIALEDRLHTREVDWLAWEDPFILGSSAAGLKHAREASLAEVHKRLSYIVPILHLIDKTALSRSRKPG